MTEDIELDTDFSPTVQQHRITVQRVLLVGTALLAAAGLTGYTAAQYLSPTLYAIAVPQLLGASVVVFGAGVGGFGLLLNYYVNPVVTAQRGKKVAAVYGVVLGLTALFVGAGTFHPRLAMVFLTLQSAGAVLYGLFHADVAVF